MKLRFWLRMLDIVLAVDVPHRLRLWVVGKASDATDWNAP